MLYYVYFVTVEYFMIFVVQSLKSPKFEKPLAEFFRWRCTLKSNRGSNYCSRDHVNHQFKFRFDITSCIYNPTLNILIVLFSKSQYM